MVTNIRQGLAQVKDDLPRIDEETVSGTESRMKKGMSVRAVVGLTYAVREIYTRLVDLNSATSGWRATDPSCVCREATGATRRSRRCKSMKNCGTSASGGGRGRT